ncbi:MAG: bifunctional hydroxymethylpyrimidine kinase/phosphomethylpyrimidine kinase, partial [Mameliella sp.]|nr:bifunctional hydroxymethylpyrimidine kinase/phosphomethylpyrimidine kinase [Mameliella sp.]
AIIETVTKGIAGLACPVVLDPVMVAKGGDRLLPAPAVAALRDMLPFAGVITPNLPEAADLLGCAEAATTEEMIRQARALLALGPGAVLLKGGHLSGDRSPDLLLSPDVEAWFDGPRTATRNTHGTGCTFSSALATALGSGLAITEAADQAKRYISAAIAAADRLSVGTGHGPVHHFHFITGTDR